MCDGRERQQCESYTRSQACLECTFRSSAFDVRRCVVVVALFTWLAGKAPPLAPPFLRGGGRAPLPGG